MQNRFLRSLQVVLVLIDQLVMMAIFFAAIILFRNHSNPDAEYAHFGITLLGGWLVLSLATGTYRENNIRSFEAFTRVSIRAFFYLLLLMTVDLFFFRLLALSRIFVGCVIVASFAGIMMNRALYLCVYYFLIKRRSWMINKVVVIGYNPMSKKLVEYLATESIDKEVVGFCEETDNVHELSPYPILSRISETLDICKKFGVSEIYSTIAPEQNLALYSLMRDADDHCIRFRIVPDLRMFYNHDMHIDHLNEIVVITARKEPLDDLGNRIKKRIMDIIVSLGVCVFLLSWLVPLVGLLIRIESPGPVFFRQKRTGKNQKDFYCLKFRSMRVNSEADSQQAKATDLRITKIGRFLRRTSLDEFPQFINVLKGEMSIVGPRPHMLKHTEEYGNMVQNYMNRLMIKQGLTGWAQTNGYRGETPELPLMEERIKHDLWYMENWSLKLDLKIIWLTIGQVFKGAA